MGTAAIGGALVIGITWRRLEHGERAAATGEGVLNAYVRIEPNERITVIVPKVEMGQGTYTSLPLLVAEELEVDPAAITVEAAPPAPPLYGFSGSPHLIENDQSTATSTSVRDCWVPMRSAGATARVMLLQAAAAHWKVSQADCQAVQGAIVHGRTGRRLTYGALAAAAALLPAPPPPPLKGAAQCRLIGRSTARRDTPDKVTGRAIYGSDALAREAQVAVVAQAPTSGGTLGAVNRDAALAVAGVTQLVSDADLVAVVARDTWSAIKGMKALAPRWNEGANGEVQQAALVADLESAAHEAGVVAATRGKLAPQHAALHHEVLYHQPFLAHAALEPSNCTAHWRDDQCELWLGTQDPEGMVRKLAALGLKPEQIRLHNLLLGGGFGRRREVDNAIIGVRVARQVRGPVRVIWERAEDIRQERLRPFYVDRLAAALDAAGHILSWQHTIAGPSLNAIYYDITLKNGVDDDIVECAANTVYELENMEVRYVRHDPRGVAVSWWRGGGATRSIFAVESFIDELAGAARQDPVAFRRAQLKDPRLLAVLDLAADRAGWGTGLPAGSGRGIAIQRAFGSYLAQVAEVRIDAQGQPHVERVVCAFDCGQVVNPDGVRAQLEGGITFGLSAALLSEITIGNGRVEQGNFNDYPALRIDEAPRIEVHLLSSGEAPGGVGETGTAGAAAALCNAIAAASGKRVRRLPVARALHA